MRGNCEGGESKGFVLYRWGRSRENDRRSCEVVETRKSLFSRCRGVEGRREEK